MSTFMTRVYEADNTFFVGELESLTIPTVDGEYGVLAKHENLVVAVLPGKMKYRTPDGEEHLAFVSDGMMRVEDGEVLILVDSAEHPEEIDIEKVKKKEAAAKEAMLQKRSLHEYTLAESSLKRAIARLKVKNGGF